MGLIERFLGALFGGGRNAVVETVEVFRENAEQGAVRAVRLRDGALAQMEAEFARPEKGGFDRFMDGVNRLPRPLLALGTLGLFVSAMVDPLWFAARMQGLALVPEAMWWLLGVVVSFYFGARHQMKAQEFRRDIAAGLSLAPDVGADVASLERMRAGTSTAVGGTVDANPALAAWKDAHAQRGGRDK